MEWPKTLPMPLASGYSFDDAFDVIRPSDALGFSPSLRLAQKNNPKPVNASLLLTFDEFAVFDWFVSRKLKYGALWLMIPLKFDEGVTQATARIAKVTTATEGRHWKISLTLEVMTYGHSAKMA